MPQALPLIGPIVDAVAERIRAIGEFIWWNGFYHGLAWGMAGTLALVLILLLLGPRK